MKAKEKMNERISTAKLQAKALTQQTLDSVPGITNTIPAQEVRNLRKSVLECFSLAKASFLNDVLTDIALETKAHQDMGGIASEISNLQATLTNLQKEREMVAQELKEATALLQRKGTSTQKTKPRGKA